MTTPLTSISATVTATLVAAVGVYVLKRGVSRADLSRQKFRLLASLGLGLSLCFLASIIFVAALQRGQLSVLYPVVSLTYVWVTILARVFLREAVTRRQLAGLVFILLGVVLVSLESSLGKASDGVSWPVSEFVGHATGLDFYWFE